MSEVHATLVKAKAYLLKHGWRPDSRRYRQNGRPQCVLGSLFVVADDDSVAFEARRAVAVAMGVTQPQVPNWNDAHTFAEVIAVLDQAILQTAPAPQPETPSPSVTHVFA